MASFRKRSNGWEYRISYKNMYGKYDQLTKGGFRTKAEAVNVAAIAKKDLLDGSEPLLPTLSLRGRSFLGTVLT